MKKSTKNIKKEIKKDMKIETQKEHNSQGVIPISDRILIKEDVKIQENKTASGIIIPVTVNEDKGGKSGKVVAVGPGRYENGSLVPMSVKVGDKVLFQWGDKVSINNIDYYLVKETELLAIIK